jgi:hypothetical protein
MTQAPPNRKRTTPAAITRIGKVVRIERPGLL